MSSLDWAGVIAKLENGLDLLPLEAQAVMREVLEDRADKEVLKSFLIALKNKGETPEEVGALVAQMYQFCAPITINERAVDTVGTGGDGAHTINISTTTASTTSSRRAVGVTTAVRNGPTCCIACCHSWSRQHATTPCRWPTRPE
jgi:anthranilate phosphoribosyltransferase